jgi:hypothetical protein
MVQGKERLAGLHVPDDSPPIAASGQQALPVRVEGHGVEATIVAAGHPLGDLARDDIDQDRT